MRKLALVLVLPLLFLVACGPDASPKPVGPSLVSPNQQSITKVTIDGKPCLWYQHDEHTANGYQVTIVAFDCDWHANDKFSTESSSSSYGN